MSGSPQATWAVKTWAVPDSGNFLKTGSTRLLLSSAAQTPVLPPEYIFDQGLGALFIVRTAGNVVDDVALGSIEYGAEHLAIPLIVVLGHEQCGAVKATVDGGEFHGCIKTITDKIALSLHRVGRTAAVYEDCADENIRQTISDIKNNKIVAELIHEGKTEVVGAKYGLRTGKVTFMS